MNQKIIAARPTGASKRWATSRFFLPNRVYYLDGQYFTDVEGVRLYKILDIQNCEDRQIGFKSQRLDEQVFVERTSSGTTLYIVTEC